MQTKQYRTINYTAKNTQNFEIKLSSNPTKTTFAETTNTTFNALNKSACKKPDSKTGKISLEIYKC